MKCFRKILPPVLFLILFLLPVRAAPVLQKYRIRVMDEQGKAVPEVCFTLAGGSFSMCSKTASDGTLMFEVPEGEYRWINDTIREGYYRIPETEAEGTAQVTLVKVNALIHVRDEEGQDLNEKFELYREDQLIADQIGTDGTAYRDGEPVTFSADAEYELRLKQDSGLSAMPEPLTFRTSEYPPEEEIFDFLYQPPGIVRLSMPENTVCEIRMQGTQEVLQTITFSDEPVCLRLAEGIYEASVTDADPIYALASDPFVFECGNAEERTYDFSLRPETVRVTASAAGSVFFLYDEEGNESVYTEAQIPVLRGRSYEIRCAVPDGYYPCEPVHFTASPCGEDVIAFEPQPFVTEILLCDPRTGEEMSGGVFELAGPDGSVTEISSHAFLSLGYGKTYTLRAQSVPEGWDTPEPYSFTVQSGEHSGTMRFTAGASARVDVQVCAKDSSGNTAEIMYEIYEDPECQKKAETVYSGTYYLKITSVPEDFYPIEEVREIHTDHAAEPVHMEEIQLKKPEYRISARGSHGEEIAAAYQIRDEEGTVYEEISAGETVTLCASHSYTVYEIRTGHGYLTAEPFALHTPEQDPGHLLETDLAHTHYVTLTLKDAAGQTVTLYTDAAEEQKALDIYGQEACGHGESLSFDLAEGTYYVRSEPDSPHYYAGLPFSVYAGEDREITLTREEAAFAVERTDASGNAREGVRLKITDEDGTVIEEWNTGSSVHVIRDERIERGKTYLICEKGRAEIAYSVPEICPDGIPVITVKDPAKPSAVSPEAVPAEQNKNKNPYLPFIFIGFSMIFGIVIVFRNKKGKMS